MDNYDIIKELLIIQGMLERVDGSCYDDEILLTDEISRLKTLISKLETAFVKNNSSN